MFTGDNIHRGKWSTGKSGKISKKNRHFSPTWFCSIRYIMFDFSPRFSGNFRLSITNIDSIFLFLSFSWLHAVNPFNNFRKHTEMYSIFITSSVFWPTTLIKLKSTMDVFTRSFTNFARRLFPMIPCFYVKGIYNLMPVFTFKNS